MRTNKLPIINARRASQNDVALTFNTSELPISRPRVGDMFAIAVKKVGTRKVFKYLATASRKGKTLYTNTPSLDFGLPNIGNPIECRLVNITPVG